MYPLNMTTADGCGFAVANDAGEHQALTAAGYGPAYAREQTDAAQPETVESLRAKLDAAGIAYDRRFGIDKLSALLLTQ